MAILGYTTLSDCKKFAKCIPHYLIATLTFIIFLYVIYNVLILHISCAAFHIQVSPDNKAKTNNTF